MKKSKFKCKYCKEEFKTYLCGRKTAIFCSRKCFGKAHSGENNPLYNPLRRKKNIHIQCACGCGNSLLKYDIHFRERKYIKGHNFRGKKRTKENIKNISLAKQGIKNPMYGIRGEKSANWKGGKTILASAIRCVYEYNNWRRLVFERDNYTCQECGLRGGKLEAHHIKRFSIILDEYNIKTVEEALLCNELWAIKNGKTLCKKCHDPTKGREPRVDLP